MSMILPMQSGAEQFDDWMRRRGFKPADAARYLEFDEPYISVLRSGKRTPGLENAIKLERLTGIPVEAWSSSELDEDAATVSASSRKRQSSQDDNP